MAEHAGESSRTVQILQTRVATIVEEFELDVALMDTPIKMTKHTVKRCYGSRVEIAWWFPTDSHFEAAPARDIMFRVTSEYTLDLLKAGLKCELQFIESISLATAPTPCNSDDDGLVLGLDAEHDFPESSTCPIVASPCSSFD
jgi:hypothetical protein